MAEWSKAPDSRAILPEHSGPQLWAWVRIPLLTKTILPSLTCSRTTGTQGKQAYNLLVGNRQQQRMDRRWRKSYGPNIFSSPAVRSHMPSSSSGVPHAHNDLFSLSPQISEWAVVKSGINEPEAWFTPVLVQLYRIVFKLGESLLSSKEWGFSLSEEISSAYFIVLQTSN